MPTIRLNDCDIYYETVGDRKKQPVVLLHAFPLDHWVWQPQLETLSGEYWIIAPDFRGHGKSEATSEPYSMDLLASDVKALVQSLGAKNIVLGGISMGGYVAMAYARSFVEDLRALILVDTKMEADSPQARQGRLDNANLVLTEGVPIFAERLLPKLFSKENVESSSSIVYDARKAIYSMNPMGIVGALQGMMERADSTQLLETIRIPTLIIVGENDLLTTVDDSKRMAGKILDSKLAIISDCAHISTLEQPETVTNAIQLFLRQNQLARRANPA